MYLNACIVKLASDCPCPSWCIEKLIDKLLIIKRLNPCRANLYINIRGFNPLRLYLFKCCHIACKFFCLRIACIRCHSLCYTKLVSHIAGKILVCCLPADIRIVLVVAVGIKENQSVQLFHKNCPSKLCQSIITKCYLISCLPGLFCKFFLYISNIRLIDREHIGKIYISKFIDGYIQCFHSSLNPVYDSLCLNRLLIKHIRFFHLPVFIYFFKTAKKWVIAVISESYSVCF